MQEPVCLGHGDQAEEAVRILSDARLVITNQGKGNFVRPLTQLKGWAMTATRPGTARPDYRRSCWNAPSRTRLAGLRFSA